MKYPLINQVDTCLGRTDKDFFYSDLLLKVGGYIVLDDALHAGPAKVIRYLVENYTHYKRVDVNVRTIAVFKKMKKDDREWSFHKNF